MPDTFKIEVRQGNITTAKSPLLFISMFQAAKKLSGVSARLDGLLGDQITHVLSTGDYKGKLGETLTVYPRGGDIDRVVLVGLGEKKAYKEPEALKVGGVMADVIRASGIEKATSLVHGAESPLRSEALARAITEGLCLKLYRYHKYLRDGRAETLTLKVFSFMEENKPLLGALRKGVETGKHVASAMNETRDLVNGPSNEVTPGFLAKTAQRLGRAYGFKVKVLEKEQCEKLGMGAFLGVAQGTKEPCKFIVMDYEGAKTKGTLCLVGKGITFDTGGISLKPSTDMDLMKYDMGGSGAVIGAMRFAAEHKLPLHVVGIIASTENMPGGAAYKPGDILTAMNGVTIEVLNTDAEGRLVLADALSYAERYEPDAVVDLATLTGACVIALSDAIALLGNDESLLTQVRAAGERGGDKVWPMPLWRQHREMVKSQVADILNSAGREGGTLTAAAFLGAFTNGYRWVHMDIAGAAWNKKDRGAMTRGATAGGVRTLCQLMMDWKKPKTQNPKPGKRTSLRHVPETAAGENTGRKAKK